MDARIRFDTQVVGALPVIMHYFGRLRLGEIINKVVPWEGGVPLGTLVEIMIANRMLNPEALYRIGDWAKEAGLTDYYGLLAKQLNDDLLGRALERLAKYRNVIEAAVVTEMIKTFKVQVNQVHFDVTDVELYGAYAQQFAAGQTPPTPLPTYGRTKSGRKNVKQIGLGLNVTARRGRAYRPSAVGRQCSGKPGPFGKPADPGENPGQERLHLHRRYETRHHGKPADDYRGQWILPLRRRLPTPPTRPVSQAQTCRQAAEGGLLSAEPSALPPDERNQYEAVETTAVLKGTVSGKKIRTTYRLIFVWSEAKARQEAETRERHASKIREEFEAIERNLNKYSRSAPPFEGS